MNDFNLNASLVGLNTFTLIVPSAGPYVIAGKLSLPSIATGGGGSSVVVTVNQNSSPVYTGLAGAEGFKVQLLCAASDQIDVVLSSSNANDQPLNAVKANISCSQGQGL